MFFLFVMNTGGDLQQAAVANWLDFQQFDQKRMDILSLKDVGSFSQWIFSLLLTGCNYCK